MGERTKRLRSTVYVHDEGGQGTRYEVGTPWSEELGKAIPNPAAWREVDDEAEARAAAAASTSGRTMADVEAENQRLREELAAARAASGQNMPDEPPRSGQGATEDAWRAYAVNVGAVDEESAATMSRQELQSAVDSLRQQQ